MVGVGIGVSVTGFSEPVTSGSVGVTVAVGVPPGWVAVAVPPGWVAVP